MTICLLFLLLLTYPASAQDSVMVKKPVPRVENMPKRQGRGTAQPMPSPQYRSRQVPLRPMDRAPIPRDSSKGTTKRDTVK